MHITSLTCFPTEGPIHSSVLDHLQVRLEHSLQTAVDLEVRSIGRAGREPLANVVQGFFVDTSRIGLRFREKYVMLTCSEDRVYERERQDF